MTSVELQDLTKRYGKAAVVDRICAQIPQGELLALLGPSGCGKTTTLRMLAGIIPPDSGRVLFGDRDVTNLPPESRDVGLVFQHYALFPHKSVFDNLAFGLRMRQRRHRELREPVEHMLHRLRLGGLSERVPAELSGGQRQRVALGRALITHPSVLLLDEPLSNLDANLREEMRFYIRDLVTEFGITTIYVTHDQAEALAMADRIAVMMDGAIAQLATPQEVYNRPGSSRVASFIGVANLLPGRVVAGDRAAGDGALVTVQGPWGTARVTTAAPDRPGHSVVISVRPEDITVTPSTDDAPASDLRPGPGGSHTFADGTLEQIAYLGHAIDYRIRVAGITVRAQGNPRRLLAAGERVRVEFTAECAWAVASGDEPKAAASTSEPARQVRAR